MTTENVTVSVADITRVQPLSKSYCLCYSYDSNITFYRQRIGTDK